MGTPNLPMMMRCMHTASPTRPDEITDAMTALRDIMASAESGRAAYVDEMHRWAHCHDGRVDALVKGAMLLLAEAGYGSKKIDAFIHAWRTVQPRRTGVSKLIPEPTERKTQPLW